MSWLRYLQLWVFYSSGCRRIWLVYLCPLALFPLPGETHHLGEARQTVHRLGGPVD